MQAAGKGTVSLFIAPAGLSTADGSQEHPFATLPQAQAWLRTSGLLGRVPVVVTISAGTYYLSEPMLIRPEDSGKPRAPVTYRGAPGARVVISGGSPLALHWEPYKDGILVADVPGGFETDQLFVDGEREPLARYPNFDASAQYLGGTAADALSPERTARWAHPEGAIIHALDKNLWGDFHYLVSGRKADGTLAYDGGWQTNRPAAMHPAYRYVENVFEELDAPGEWYLDRAANKLYAIPPKGKKLERAQIEGVRLEQLVEFRGTSDKPVHDVHLEGLVFTQTRRTFMKTREPLLRTDWCLYRGAAVFMTGVENCSVTQSDFVNLGGNALFVSGFARRVEVSECLFAGCGASGALFVGEESAVRSPLLNYSQRQPYSALDLVPGPKGPDYPSDCTIENCLIHDTGTEEKQSAGVGIDIAARIRVLHCTIYDVPRAGINIGDGCFGGDLISGCDVFNTVRETGDHGSFNAWGRDRYWNAAGTPQEKRAETAVLDAVELNVIENSRWRCDNGWDIDLDDGSSHYLIRNNLLLHGGLKLREGYYRTAMNNIVVNNSLHPHVWFEGSHDIVERNLFMGRYHAALMKITVWGERIDHNFFTTNEADRDAFRDHGADAHSLVGDPFFVDPARGDFMVERHSPALATGFVNFPMDQFGVTSGRFGRVATPEIPRIRAMDSASTPPAYTWDGAEVRDLAADEYSVAGLAQSAGGVLLDDVPPYVAAAHRGFRPDDVLESVDGVPVKSVADLIQTVAAEKPGARVRITVRRAQADVSFETDSPLGPLKAGR